MAKGKFLPRPKQKVGEGIPMHYVATYPTREEAEKRARATSKALGGTIWGIRKRKNGYALYLAS